LLRLINRSSRSHVHPKAFEPHEDNEIIWIFVAFDILNIYTVLGIYLYTHFKFFLICNHFEVLKWWFLSNFNLSSNSIYFSPSLHLISSNATAKRQVEVREKSPFQNFKMITY
jgi:hypothetical protein